MIKTFRSNLQQTTLRGYEQAQCQCGCKEYFMRRTDTRPALYKNPTHKKRAARARARARSTETRVYLTPKGIKRASELAETNYTRLWDMLTIEEQWVLELANRHPSGTYAFWYAVETLQRRAGLQAFTLKDEGEARPEGTVSDSDGEYGYE